jgi:hypothetical protein
MNYDIENPYETEVKLDIYYDSNVTIHNDIEQESSLVEYTNAVTKYKRSDPNNILAVNTNDYKNPVDYINIEKSPLFNHKLTCLSRFVECSSSIVLPFTDDSISEYYNNASPLSVSESNSSEDEAKHSSFGVIKPLPKLSGVHFNMKPRNSIRSDDFDDEDNQSETEKKDIANGGFQKSERFKKLSYEDVEKSLNRYYDIDSKYSNELDVLITYLNGQKNLYLRAQHITHRNLNALQLPSILFSSSIAIFTPFIHHYQWSFILITVLNTIITFFISVIRFLKLESSAETYGQVANQYEKLSSSLEIASNKLLFMDNEIDQNNVALEKIKEFETELNNIKDSCDIIIPLEVKQLYPIISYINIFSIIKKMDIYKNHLIMKFKDIKNEIRYILFKWSTQSETIDRSKEKARLEYLYAEKDKIKEELIQTKTAYNYIDEMFSREIKQAETKQSNWCCFDQPTKPEITHCNPVIDKYMKFIFND